MASLNDSEPDRLGWSLALNGEGNILLAGAPRRAADGVITVGVAYIYEQQSVGSWSPLYTLGGESPRNMSVFLRH